jgi:hypothetical protein
MPSREPSTVKECQLVTRARSKCSGSQVWAKPPSRPALGVTHEGGVAVLQKARGIGEIDTGGAPCARSGAGSPPSSADYRA